jgi:hypothetical protein
MTAREWQRLENTMQFVVGQQAKFEARFEADFDKAKDRFIQEKRVD